MADNGMGPFKRDIYIYIYLLCFDLIKWEEKIENEGT